MSLRPFHSFAFCLSSIFLSHISAYSQENSYLNFSVADGLPSTEVYQTIQDKNGFIWFATDNGVVKFDGGDFEVINSKRGLSDPVVFGLHEDLLGRIWFRTFTGKLSYYQHGKVYKYAYNDLVVSLSGKDIISDIYYDSLDQLWFTAGDKINRIDKLGNTTTEKIPSYALDFRQLNSKKDLLAYSGPTHRLNRANINGQYFPIQPSDTTQSRGLLCKIRWGNKKYFSINSDLFEYDKGLRKVFTALTPIISLSIDKDNRLWIGCINGGVQRIEDTDFNNLFTVNEIAEKSVTSVLQDEERGFWITTLEKGVFYFPNFSIKKFNLLPNSKLSSVNSVSGKIITTEYSGKITAFNSTGKILWKKELDPPITTAHINRLNHLWVSSYGETFVLNEYGEILKRKLPSNFVSFAATSSKIYGVNSWGLLKFDLEGNSLSTKKLKSQFRSIHVAGKDIYMGGKNGLYLFDSAFNNSRELKEFMDIKVSRITPLADSVLLISTIGNGYILFDKNKNETITNFGSTNRFIANNIYCVLKLDSSVWLGTEKGIAVTTVNSLLSGKSEFNFFTKHSGLVSDKVNFLAAIPGEIWAFCDEGFTQLPINQLRYIKQYPIGYIKEMKMNNVPVDFQNSMDFNSRQNNIQIQLGFLSFNNQNILARFRLTAGEPWIISDNWTFLFNSLVPGQYKIQAEYSTDNLNWFAIPIDLSFRVRSPWWNTWYFMASTGLLILLIGVFIYRIRVMRYKEKNTYLQVINEQQKKLLNAEIEATERERSRIAKDLHDGIGMDLVSIKLLANQIEKKTENKDALEIQSVLQKTISEIQNIIYGLAPSGLKLFGLSHGIENYISMVNRNHSTSINFDFQGGEVKDEQIGAVVYRIIQELITNSIKHSYCSTISIQIKASSSYIQIVYHDNGIGFDLNNAKPGLGLSNIRSRVESLEGILTVESDATGTLYSINLPLKGR